MIAVIDYGMGNLGSVSKALKSLGAEVRVTQRPSDLKKCQKIVLPGVGAFRDSMQALTRLNMIDALKEELAAGKKYLGICLGLELLFEKSEEGGTSKGLGILKGEVVRFSGPGLKVPHIGWNQVRIESRQCPLFEEIDDATFFYFVHSYYVKPHDCAITAAVTDYGSAFASMVWEKNIYAVQFHPEKSQAAGLQFLKNFIGL